jgi:hypothetical protein
MVHFDKNQTEIKKGSIIKFQHTAPHSWKEGKTRTYEAWGRITRITKTTVNVGGVWGGRIFAKQVPISEVTECAEEFYDNWRNSETYRCM